MATARLDDIRIVTRGRKQEPLTDLQMALEILKTTAAAQTRRKPKSLKRKRYGSDTTYQRTENELTLKRTKAIIKPSPPGTENEIIRFKGAVQVFAKLTKDLSKQKNGLRKLFKKKIRVFLQLRWTKRVPKSTKRKDKSGRTFNI